MKKSEKYISNKTKQIIENYLNIINCNHEWKKEGYGYTCIHCDYYTGLDKELNKLIKIEMIKNPLKYLKS